MVPIYVNHISRKLDNFKIKKLIGENEIFIMFSHSVQEQEVSFHLFRDTCVCQECQAINTF